MKIIKTCYIFPVIIILVTFTTSLPTLLQPRDSVVLDYSAYNAFQPEGVGSYSFGYEIEDPEYRNIQYRDEERHQNGTVTGSYGWVKPDGNVIMVKYVADAKGYRASVENSQGQIRFHGQPIPTYLKETSKSPSMLDTINKLNLYKKQRVEEQRYRPIDQAQNFKKVNTFVEDNKNNLLLDYNNIEPKRLYFNSNFDD